MNLIKNGRLFQITGGYVESPAFFNMGGIKTIMIRIDPINGSKTFDIYFSTITRTSFRRRKPGVDGSL